MIVKVLGPADSATTQALVDRSREAVSELPAAVRVETVADDAVIAGYDVMVTPALVVDEQVVLQGRVPTVHQLQDLFEYYAMPEAASRPAVRVR